MENKQNRYFSPLWIGLYFALAAVVVHILTANGYGYFRDELYFLATSEHLAFGYVDMAPMVAWITKLSRLLFGDSLLALRLLPALASGGLIFLAALITKELGGKRFATVLACLSVLVAPGILAIGNYMSMNVFEPLFWMGCAYLLILAINRQNPKYWLGFGALAGLGLMNKHSMLFFGFALLAALLLTRYRRLFFSKWFWLGGALALLIFLPNLIWECSHDWATWELLQNVRETGKNVVLSPPEFLWQQVFLLLPLTAPVWLAGLWYFLFSKEGKYYRFLGLAYLIVLVIMIALSAKNYYMLPAYATLFAGGGIFWERLLEQKRFALAIKAAAFTLLIVAGAASAPIAIPVLPVKTFISYQQALGMESPKTEVEHIGPLPQQFGDRFGWPEMVETVARVYQSLPPQEREKTAIWGGNYGEAGAIDLFGSKYGLPKAISSHQNYYLWGPRDYTGEVIILLQADIETAEEVCGNLQEAEKVGHPFAMAEEHYTIYICRDLKLPLKEFWPRAKNWN